MNEERRFYVYFHRRNDTGSVFYVGKGSGRRAYWKNQRNKHWHHVVDKHGYTVEIIKDNLTEDESFDLERNMIIQYGKENLCNYTDGGDGASGAIRTEEQKEHMRQKMQGREFSSETIERMRIAAIERCKNPEYQKKRVATMIGRKLSPEHIEKLRKASTGRVLDSKSIKKISDFHKGKKKKPEAVAAMAASKSKKILCINNGLIYPSAREAARQLNLSNSKVAECAKGMISKTKGYQFEYLSGI